MLDGEVLDSSPTVAPNMATRFQTDSELANFAGEISVVTLNMAGTSPNCPLLFATMTLLIHAKVSRRSDK